MGIPLKPSPNLIARDRIAIKNGGQAHPDVQKVCDLRDTLGMHAPVIVFVLGDECLRGAQVLGQLFLAQARGLTQPRQALPKGLFAGWQSVFDFSRHHEREVYLRFAEWLVCCLTEYHR
jgi:hypothetical protein